MLLHAWTRASRVWVADVPAFFLASEAGISQVMGLKGNEAQKFVEKLYKVVLEPQKLTLDADVQG